MFTLALAHRFEIIRQYKQRGGRVAAVLPYRYPRALLRAFDLLPVEVWGPPRMDVTRGAAHLQPYVCSLVRNALAFALSGGLDVADVLVVPHACDSLQGLGSLLIDFVRPRQPVLPLYLPRGRRASDTDFLVAELRSLYRRLQEITGRAPSDDELGRCIRCEEAADQLLADLDRQRRVVPLTQYEFYRLIRSREYLPAETFSELAQSVLAQAGLTQAGSTPRAGIPIMLSGLLPEPMNLFEFIAEMDGLVVADDLACCGRRLYPPGASRDPFRRMAESLLSAPPDSMHGNPIAQRIEHLLHLAQSSGAKGVVFYDVKFCEPELFDLPLLRQGLQAAGLPSVAIEFDLNEPLAHQTRTRLEAFLEMIA